MAYNIGSKLDYNFTKMIFYTEWPTVFKNPKKDSMHSSENIQSFIMMVYTSADSCNDWDMS